MICAHLLENWGQQSHWQEKMQNQNLLYIKSSKLYTSFYSLFFLTTWPYHPYAMPFQPSTFCDQESCRMRGELRDKPKNGLFCGTDSQLRDDGALEYIYVLTGFFIPNSILFGNKSTSKAKLKRAVSFWN